MSIQLRKNTLIQDAGTAIFQTHKGMGTVLGQVKTELANYGKVYKADEVTELQSYNNLRDFEFIVDVSNLFWKQYIVCFVEDSGDSGKKTIDGESIRKYAVSFKEWNKSSNFRIFCFIFIALLALIVPMLFEQMLFLLISLLLAFYCLWAILQYRPNANMLSIKLIKHIQKAFQ